MRALWSTFGAILLFEVQSVLSQSTVPTNATNLPLGSCTAEIPCSNQACCNSHSGFCGFGSEFCTPLATGGSCSSNCDAKAECGPDAPPANTTCPLNVCCSQFGFCGTTQEFCEDGCQSNCGAPAVPSCGVDEQTAITRRIGYYEGWAVGRKCMAYPPEQISAETLTHINFAFALIESGSFRIIEMTNGDTELWKRTTALKSRNPTLKVYLSIGGWTFNDPPTSHVFSDLASSTANINAFVTSALGILETYGFDGIDIDWEYPSAFDRGGVPADKANYVTLMAAIKKAFAGPGYGLTFTAPSSYWYLQHFDLPNMLKHADWVNVMTYDLHGTWDGKDPFIGFVVGAHTNLTEIDAAFKLYWRVGVKPEQMVMGMGFYGRSFTLASSECASPGCIWTSGGNEGPCSGNAGTLMYAEIASILTQTSGISPSLDSDAAVKSIVWDNNQWVSYDDAESFAIKMNYANDHCIGGTMIWSLDQDDSQYSVLQALYPDISAAGSGLSQNDTCFVSDCGAKSCGDGYNSVGSTTTSLTQPAKNCDRLICCPNGDTPASCGWRGSDTSPCNPSCNAGETILTTEACPSGGSRAFCCETSDDAIGECAFVGCGDTCPGEGDFNTPLTVGIRGAGSPNINFCTSKSCPETCTGGQTKPFCCTNLPLPFENCKWIGTPPLCQDSACAPGQVQLISDPQGDGKSPCSGTAVRHYCCDLAGDSFLPVPFDDVFPDDVLVASGSTTFRVEFDPDEGAKEGAEGAGTSSPMPADEVENDEAFGEVFIDSPNPSSVSSMTLASDWVVASCHPTTDQPQKVLAFCSKPMDAPGSGCSHVLIGGPEHTIVQMPADCGRGPYARIASLVPHPDQTILSKLHQAKKPAGELVYSLEFDYNFAVIPESNGPIYMRADVTDLPDYWDNIVDSPPERKRWLKERGLEKRWWGTFTKWVSKLTTVEKDTSVSRNFHWSDTWTIFHKEVSCPGPPAFEASLDVSLTGKADLNSRYGFYLQATIVPPAVQAAYLYFSADASTSAQFTILGEASVTYDSSVVQFASFGFPGLYYPGLLTVGPSLVLNGYITGEISIQGKFTTNVEYKFPSVNFNLGKTSDSIGDSVNPSSSPITGIDLTAGYSVELAGDLSVHVVPTVQLGINVLNGAVIDAQAFVRTDLFAGLAVNGSVSNTQAPEVCLDAYYGVDMAGGVTGSVLFWESSPTVWHFYQNQFSLASKCFGSVMEPTTISGRSQNGGFFHHSVGTIAKMEPSSHGPAFISERHANHGRKIFPQGVQASNGTQHLKKRDVVPPCPGVLSCPPVNDQINVDGDLSDNDPYSDLSQNTLEDAVYRKRGNYHLDDWSSEDITGREISPNVNVSTSAAPHILVAVPSCGTVKFSPLAYNNAANGAAFFDFTSPTAGPGSGFSPTYGPTGKAPGAKSSTYGREHIYEMQLLAGFIGSLATTPNLWQNAAGNTNFCSWVRTEVVANVLPNLLQCVPSNNGVHFQQMPWLESVANGIKASAISGITIRTMKTFNKYTYTKKLFVMRATAGAASYLANPFVQTQFVAQSACVKSTWNTWYNGYVNNPNNGAPNAGNLPVGGITGIYSTWIRGVMGGVSGRLFQAVTNMIAWWNTQAGGNQVSQNVVINYGTQLQGAGNVAVAGQDLVAISTFIQNNAINWVNQL